MKLALTTALILSFFGLAVLGFANMRMAIGHNNMENCIATAVQGTVCPEAPGTVGFINFHANAARFFSTAVFGASVSAIVAFFMRAFGTSFLNHLRVLPLLAKYRLPQFLLSPAALPKDALNSWLSLHEKRDPALSFSFRPI